ncbi:hypothetical protein GDO81_026820 [Engystomops pustulosus]|uniref:Cadherin domain-containing protein n=1 Tax=Engystomops pustulosus TaxID=76066 RepID=A0AAV6YGM0_ENGPU|nr:hypothetical protein GDO81_026820 [Engystomops pustulosus]
MAALIIHTLHYKFFLLVTATIIVSVTPVNNFYPEFDSPAYNFTVQETSGAGTEVGKVSATDKDLPSCVTYKIREGNNDIVNRFWINPTSGVIELVSQLDFEIKDSHKLVIEASDCDPDNPRIALVTVSYCFWGLTAGSNGNGCYSLVDYMMQVPYK